MSYMEFKQMTAKTIINEQRQ